MTTASPSVAPSATPKLDGGEPTVTAIDGAGAASTSAVQTDMPRNALDTLEPTPQQWAQLLAIRASLSPREAAIAQTVVVRMTPEMRAQWLAELSALSVEQAVEVVRSMIPAGVVPKTDAKNRGKADR